MSLHITLTKADLDTLVDGGTIGTSAGGVTFEVTDEDSYTGPPFSDGVCRFGLDRERLADLRKGITRKVWPVGIDESITIEVAR